MLIIGPTGLITGPAPGPGCGLSVAEVGRDDEGRGCHGRSGDGDSWRRLAVPGFRLALLGGSAGGHRAHWVGCKAGAEGALPRTLVALARVCSEGHLKTLDGGAEVVLVGAYFVGTRARWGLTPQV